MTIPDPEQNKKRTHIFMLLMLAEADNVDHDLELIFISKVASRLGITDEEVAYLDQNPQSITFTIPKREHKRMEILYDLLFLMKFDQHVDQSEIELIHRLAFRMGFRPTMTQEMIEVMKQHIGKLVPKNSLLDIVKKYMN
jgi:uncharacterized tellurite resistance protein B-like protein